MSATTSTSNHKNPSYGAINGQSAPLDDGLDYRSDSDNGQHVISRSNKNHNNDKHIIDLSIKSLKALPPEEQVPLVLAYITAPNDKQETPLNMAFAQHNYARVQHIFRLILSLKNPEDRLELLKIALTTTSTRTGMTPLMWAAHKNHPKWVRYIIRDVLNEIKNVKDRLGLLETLLTDKSKAHGRTVLMYAAETSAQLVQEIFAVIFSFQDDTTRFKLLITVLKATGNDGRTLLMFAAAKQPALVSYLLNEVCNRIKNPDQSLQLLREILLAKDNDGKTALMWAATYQLKAVACIMGAISNIKNPDESFQLLTKILSATSHDKMTALMIAARHQYIAVHWILDAVSNIKNPDKSFQLLTKILSATSHKGEETAIMIAARHQPMAVVWILDAICKLKNPDELAELMCEVILTKNFHGKAFPVIAARNHPKAIQWILNTICKIKCPEDVSLYILVIISQEYKDDLSILMWAAKKPEVIKWILDAVCSINDPDESLYLLRKILLRNNSKKGTVLMQAAYRQPEAVKSILESVIGIQKREVRLQLLTTILEAKSQYGWTALKLALHAHHFQTIEYIFKLLLQQGFDEHRFVQILREIPHEKWLSQYVKGYYSALYFDGRKPKNGTLYTDKNKITKYGFYHDLSSFPAFFPKIIRAIPRQQRSLLFQEFKRLQKEWAARGQTAINAVVQAGKNLVGNSSSTALNRVITDIMMLYIMGAAFEQFTKRMEQMVPSKHRQSIKSSQSATYTHTNNNNNNNATSGGLSVPVDDQGFIIESDDEKNDYESSMK